MEDVELLECVHLKLPDPLICVNTNSHTDSKCHIIKKGFLERAHCYDLEFPLYIKYQRYSCHGTSFSALNARIIQQVNEDISVEPGIIMLGKILLVSIHKLIFLTFC